MSTVFDVPCPECGHQMTIADNGDLRCPPCAQTYRARMGHLFPVRGTRPADRPTAATS